MMVELNTDLFKRISLDNVLNGRNTDLSEVSFQEIDHKKPIILCLPGSSASKEDVFDDKLMRHIPTVTDRGKEKLSGFLKLINRIFDGKAVNMQLYGVMNEYSEDDLRIRQSEYRQNPLEFESNQAKKIVNNILKPLFEKEDGSKYKVAELKQNFSRLSIFSFSYGTILSDCVGKQLIKAMENAGYENDDIKQSVKMSKLLSIGSLVDLSEKNTQTMPFSTFVFTAHNDIKTPYFSSSKKPDEIRRVSDNVMQILTTNPEEFIIFERTNNYKRIKDEHLHSPYSYTLFKFSKEAEKQVNNTSAFIVHNIVKNGINGTETDMNKMLTNNQAEIGFFKREYNKKVSKMLEGPSTYLSTSV